MNSMTIIEKYLLWQEKYEKKYGKNKTIVFMQVGNFYEAHSTNTRGYNLQELSEFLHLVVVIANRYKNKKVDGANPYVIGFPCASINRYLEKLLDGGYTVITVDYTIPPPNSTWEVKNIYLPKNCLDLDSGNETSIDNLDDLTNNMDNIILELNI